MIDFVMKPNKILENLAKQLHGSQNRQEAHEKPLVNQKIKEYLKHFSKLRTTLSKIAHATGLGNKLGLNPIKGLYYHPENGKIVETINYSKPADGPTKEILPCMFKFFQQIGFDDADFFNKIKNKLAPEYQGLVEMLISHELIEDKGITGNIRRRFTKKEILSSLN
jgi:hypothetical protein